MRMPLALTSGVNSGITEAQNSLAQWRLPRPSIWLLKLSRTGSKNLSCVSLFKPQRNPLTVTVTTAVQSSRGLGVSVCTSCLDSLAES